MAKASEADGAGPKGATGAQPSGTPPVALCRDCLQLWRPPPTAPHPTRCKACGGPRLVVHPELESLSLAHLDCDAFYASIEKRDRPELRDRPVIVGGGKRGVVSAACYVARIHGVGSAMPMFKALRACPEAVVLPVDMAKYREEGRKIRAMMLELTPLVEPLSIDEAFLDLKGTEQLHGLAPAQALARLALRVERELGLTVSIGLSYNKSLAKLASDLDKPRGFAVIGRAEAVDFLRPRPVGMIFGVGKALEAKLQQDGIRKIGDLLGRDEAALTGRYGAIGRRLFNFARGRDERPVEPDSPAKSISAETTFEEDIAEAAALARQLWPLCEKVSRRLKAAGLAASGVALKLKTDRFQTVTRSRRLSQPTRLADSLYRTALPLLEKEADGRRFRLIGIGAEGLVAGALADGPDLLDPGLARRAKVESVMDELRDRLGQESLVKGRGFRPRPRQAKE